MTPMQKIVGDSLRPEDAEDPHGVDRGARASSTPPTRLLDDAAGRASGWLAGPSFTLADCAAAPALHYARVVHRWDEAEARRPDARTSSALMARPSVARVVDEAREYRQLFPLPWPDDLD